MSNCVTHNLDVGHTAVETLFFFCVHMTTFWELIRIHMETVKTLLLSRSHISCITYAAIF